jgi:hypothetical protein
VDTKQLVAVVVLLCVACLAIGIIIPNAGVVDALESAAAPMGQALDNFLYHLNQIQ